MKLIGREGERRRVHADLAAGRSVCVAGDAGIGKTTLLRELAEATGARYGGAFAMLASMPYLPASRAPSWCSTTCNGPTTTRSSCSIA